VEALRDAEDVDFVAADLSFVDVFAGALRGMIFSLIGYVRPIEQGVCQSVPEKLGGCQDECLLKIRFRHVFFNAYLLRKDNTFPSALSGYR